MNDKTETGCCPRFDPEPWDEKEITWQDKLFVKDCVWSLLHIPLNFGRVMAKNAKKIRAEDAAAPQPIVLSDEASPWRANVYIAVGKEVPGAEMASLSGTFLTKVFEGPYKDAGKWVVEMKAFVESRGREIEKMHFFYTTCPKCAKVYGKNYTVILATV